MLTTGALWGLRIYDQNAVEHKEEGGENPRREHSYSPTRVERSILNIGYV